MEGLLVLVMLGIGSVLWPQPAYIHPDEFFQSIEVVAGDVFNISHLRTWEFNPDMPLRDVCMPYLLFAPGFYCLRSLLTLASISQYIKESYAVLVIPKMVLVLAGVVNWALVRKLCAQFAVNEKTSVWFWITSYTTWTFLTRSFSNTTETLLFSVANLLLLEMSHCFGKGELGQASSKGKEKGSLLIGQHSKKVTLLSYLVGIVLCAGFFNRPTFCVFVFAPLLWWVDQVFSTCKKTTIISVACLAGLGFVVMFIIMSVINSFYYNSEFGHLLIDLYTALVQCDVSAIVQSGGAMLDGLRVPPWSFVQYNLVSTNLAEHGLHPWYTHLLVHMPTLLGPLVFLLYGEILVLVAQWRQRHVTDVLYAIVLIPVISLSFFPHQEARFLLPVLPFATVCVARCRLASWKSIQAVTLIFNILGLVMFGWLHQGGVVPALSSLQGRLKNEAAQGSSHRIHYHILSYSTYMPPRHVLFVKQSSVQVDVHDMIGAHNHPPTLRFRVEQLHRSCVQNSELCRFWLLLPAPAMVDVESMEGWKLEVLGEFCPHVSMERLPAGGAFTLNNVQALISQLCLNVVSVIVKEKS